MSSDKSNQTAVYKSREQFLFPAAGREWRCSDVAAGAWGLSRRDGAGDGHPQRRCRSRRWWLPPGNQASARSSSRLAMQVQEEVNLEGMCFSSIRPTFLS